MNPDKNLIPQSEVRISKPLRFFNLHFNPEEQQVEIFDADAAYLLGLNRDELLTRIADVPITEWHDFVDCLEFLIESQKQPQNVEQANTSSLPSASRASQNYAEILSRYNIPHLQSLLQRVLTMTTDLDRKKLLPPIRPENIVGPNAPVVIEGMAKTIED